MRTILCPQGIPWRQDCDSYDSSQMWSVRHGFDAKPQLESSFDASYFARWFHRSESSLDPCWFGQSCLAPFICYQTLNCLYVGAISISSTVVFLYSSANVWQPNFDFLRLAWILLAAILAVVSLTEEVDYFSPQQTPDCVSKCCGVFSATVLQSRHLLGIFVSILTN